MHKNVHKHGSHKADKWDPKSKEGYSTPCWLPGVLLQVRELPEGLLTVGTVVGLDTQVYAQMLGQVGRVGEGLGTVWTLVWLGFCVGFWVDLHVRLGEEGEGTHLTPAGKEDRDHLHTTPTLFTPHYKHTVKSLSCKSVPLMWLWLCRYITYSSACGSQTHRPTNNLVHVQNEVDEQIAQSESFFYTTVPPAGGMS